MSDASVLKEFLVGLGFKVDEAGLKRFEAGVKTATEVVGAFGLAMVGAAATVEASVLKVSAQFETLFYATQNLHSSAENITSFAFAVSQIGGSADAAKGSVGALAEFMRKFPGGEKYIDSLGVQTRDSNGNLRDTVDIVQGLGASFRAMTYPAAKARAELLGIDDATLKILLWRPDQLTAGMKDAGSAIKASGLSMAQAAEASAKFDQKVRLLKLQVELLVDKIIVGLQGEAGRSLERFGAMFIRVFTAVGTLVGKALVWFNKLDQATRGWASGILVAAAALGALMLVLDPVVIAIGAVGLAIVALTDDFQTWREGGKSLIDWDQWSDQIDEVLQALPELGAAFKDLWSALQPIAQDLSQWLGPVFMGALHNGVDLLTTSLHLMADAIRAIAALLRGDWGGAWAAARKAASDALAGITSIMDRLAGKKDPPASGPSAQAHAEAQQRTVDNRGAPASPSPSAPHPVAYERPGAGPHERANPGQVIDFFKSQGWDAKSAAGIAAGANAESQLDPNATNKGSGAYGIGQWLSARQADFAKMFGHDIHGSTLIEQMKFMQAELTNKEGRAGKAIAAASSAAEAAASFITRYERPAAGAETTGDLSRTLAFLAANGNLQVPAPALAPPQRQVAANGGAGGQSGATTVNVTQKTDIHVTGGADARQTAQAVATEQTRVNGDLVRNAKVAIG